MGDDLFVGHAADAGESGDGAFERLRGEIADGECLVVGEAGGAELLVRRVEEVLGGEVDGLPREVVDAGDGGEGVEQPAVNGLRGSSVELLVHDGAEEGFERGLGRAEGKGEGPGALDEAAELWIGCGEVGDRLGDVVGGRAWSGRPGHRWLRYTTAPDGEAVREGRRADPDSPAVRGFQNRGECGAVQRRWTCATEWVVSAWSERRHEDAIRAHPQTVGGCEDGMSLQNICAGVNCGFDNRICQIENPFRRGTLSWQTFFGCYTLGFQARHLYRADRMCEHRR